jgi:S1-C subfamily serine protease
VGDIIAAIDGKPVVDTDDVQAALGTEAVGRTLELSLVRGGAPATIAATAGERPRREDAK